MKVIFLGIGGVINSVETSARTRCGHKFVDDELVEMLKELVDDTGAEVVLASMWVWGAILLRSGIVNGDYIRDYKELSEKIAEHGFSIRDVVDINEFSLESVMQGIEKYISEHGHEIDSYVIVTSKEMSDNMKKKHLNRIVITDKLVGMTEVDKNKAAEILSKNTVVGKITVDNVNEILTFLTGERAKKLIDMRVEDVTLGCVRELLFNEVFDAAIDEAEDRIEIISTIRELLLKYS